MRRRGRREWPTGVEHGGVSAADPATGKRVHLTVDRDAARAAGQEVTVGDDRAVAA